MTAPRFDPVAALRRVHGVEVSTVSPSEGSGTGDLIAEVQIGRARLRLVIETRATLDPRTLDPLLERMRPVSSGSIPLIASRYVPPGIRRRLESRGVGWLDDFGNVHVDDPAGGVVVHVERPIPRGSVPRPRGRLFGPAASRVTQALLEIDEPQDLAGLARLAHVGARSTVSRALDRLEEEHLLRRERAGWVVPDRAVLLDAWLDAKLRSPVPIARSFFTQEPRSRILDRLCSVAGGVQVLFTGSIAAERLVPLRSAELIEAYVLPPTMASRIGEHEMGWTPSEKQPVVRLLLPTDDGPRVGATERAGLPMVGAAQLILDLHREGGRAIEVANELRRRWSL